jgi:2-amino-4-hydroxy-6-hydroxymethyldihydropteridine diphosphokinase
VNRIYLSLGSNVGDRESHLRAAIDRFPPHIRVLRASPLYETAPVEFTAQPWFLNQVIEVEWAGTPRQLLRAAKAVEREGGRQATRRWGPRVIDVDLLLFGDQSVREPGLEIPHPRLLERDFVLGPLRELGVRPGGRS